MLLPPQYIALFKHPLCCRLPNALLSLNICCAKLFAQRTRVFWLVHAQWSNGMGKNTVDLIQPPYPAHQRSWWCGPLFPSSCPAELPSLHSASGYVFVPPCSSFWMGNVWVLQQTNTNKWCTVPILNFCTAIWKLDHKWETIQKMQTMSSSAMTFCYAGQLRGEHLAVQLNQSLACKRFSAGTKSGILVRRWLHYNCALQLCWCVPVNMYVGVCVRAH